MRPLKSPVGSPRHVAAMRRRIARDADCQFVHHIVLQWLKGQWSDADAAGMLRATADQLVAAADAIDAMAAPANAKGGAR